MPCVPWPLIPVLSETGTKLQNQPTFGIEFLMCSDIASYELLLLDTERNLSVTSLLPVLRAGGSAQLAFCQAICFVRGSRHKSFCQVVKYLVHSSNSSA